MDINDGNSHDVTVTDGESQAIDILRSAIPALDGDDISEKKATYLSYRISNFSRPKAEKLTGVSHRQVQRWRASDSNFAYLDGEGLTELRKNLANEFLDMQFTRNFRMVMEKDFRILYKDATSEPMTASELKYIPEIRKHYTPQSLALVKQLLAGGTTEEPFNYSKYVLEIQRERITIHAQK